MALLKKKPVQAAAAVTLAAAIVLAGTFAWNSFNQSRINVFKELVAPDVNLHDDFEGGPNKDIYVENSGQANIYVRVRLTEFLQTENRGSLVEGQVRDDDKAYLWAPHNATDKIENCALPASNTISAEWNGENFHDYYTWTMGGQNEANPTAQIYYKPATQEQKGEYDENGNVLRDPQVVSDPLTGTSAAGDASVDYAALVAAKIAELQAADTSLTDEAAEQAALAELGLKKTQPASVITMAEWSKGKGTSGDVDYRAPYAQGDFWVIDESDGWAYWANPLPGGSATGLLLDKVTRTDKPFDSNAEYAINAWLQAVDEKDFGQFAANGGGISEGGMKLLQLAAGKIAIAADGAIYANNGDGTYIMTTDKGGTPAADAKAFVPLGSEGVNTPEANRLEIGQRITIDELEWDGSVYTNYDDFTTAPLYNIYKTAVTSAATDQAATTTSKQIYQVIGTRIGVDKQVYLMVQPIVENTVDGVTTYDPNAEETLYLASVKQEGEASPYTYSQTTPGTAPFGFIWPNANGALGAADSGRLDPNVTLQNRSFSLLGNGVYLETTTPVDAVSEGEPAKTTYFFAGKVLSKANVTGAAGDDVATKVNNLFPLQLTVGDTFTITGGDTTGDTTTAVTAYEKVAAGTDGAYTMTELVKGVNGSYYIYLGSDKAGYVGPGADGFLAAPQGGTTKDARAWDGGMGIGSSTDKANYPGDFSEGFLKGKDSKALDVGKSIVVDGYDWMVIGQDEFGNRLLLTKTAVSSMGARTTARDGDHPYASTDWPSRAVAFTNTLTNLKPYAMGVNLPAEQAYLAAEIRASNDVSTCVANKTGAVAFVPSASDINEYIFKNASVKDKLYTGTVYGIRSQVKSAGGKIYGAAVSKNDSNFASDVGLGSTESGTYVNFYDQYHSTNYPPRMALWVRFSDADQIATATPDQMDAWKNMPAVGSTVTFGNYPQNQAAATPVQPIEWTVLTTQGTKALLLSAKTLVNNTLTGTGDQSKKIVYTQWKDTPTREFLNNAFLNTAFNKEEQAKIQTTTVITAGMNNTQDKVFIPSYEELTVTYRANLLSPNTAYAKTGMYYPNQNWYWLRSTNNAGAAFIVGTSYGRATNGSGDFMLGIRPMIWVDYKPS